MNKPLIPIVDEDDNIVGHKLRSQVSEGEIYRVSALWLTNSRGQILLAQRGLNQTHEPGVWGPAVAGTVEKDETYQANIKKEVREELGLNDIPLTPGPKQRKSGKYDFFCQWYTAVVDQPAEAFVIQKEELEQVRWFDRDELVRDLRDHPERYLDLSWPLAQL